MTEPDAPGGAAPDDPSAQADGPSGLICPRCRRAFTPAEDGQVFCRKACAKKMRERERLARRRRDVDLLTEPGPLCPRPYKEQFPTREAAAAAGAPLNQRPYLCRCRVFHLTKRKAGSR